MEIYLQLSRGTEEGQSMLFATAVSQVFLIQSNHCATVECFGVSCPAPHQEHRLPGPSPSSYRELTQGQSGAACLHTLWLQALSSAHLLSFSQVGVYHGCCFLVKSWGLSALIPSHHTHKGPERSPTPAPPHSVLFWTTRPLWRGCDLRGRALQVDEGTSQGSCPDQVTGPGQGQQGKPRGHRVLCMYLFPCQSRASVLTTEHMRRGRPVACIYVTLVLNPSFQTRHHGCAVRSKRHLCLDPSEKAG